MIASVDLFQDGTEVTLLGLLTPFVCVYMCVYKCVCVSVNEVKAISSFSWSVKAFVSLKSVFC